MRAGCSAACSTTTGGSGRDRSSASSSASRASASRSSAAASPIAVSSALCTAAGVTTVSPIALTKCGSIPTRRASQASAPEASPAFASGSLCDAIIFSFWVSYITGADNGMRPGRTADDRRGVPCGGSPAPVRSPVRNSGDAVVPCCALAFALRRGTSAPPCCSVGGQWSTSSNRSFYLPGRFPSRTFGGTQTARPRSNRITSRLTERICSAQWGLSRFTGGCDARERCRECRGNLRPQLARYTCRDAAPFAGSRLSAGCSRHGDRTRSEIGWHSEVRP